LRKQASVIFLFRIIRLAAALYNISLAAQYFGLSLQRDIWLLALNGIIVFDLLIWGPLNETFRAKFLFIKTEQGEDFALSRTKSLFVFTTAISIFVVGLLLLFPDVLAKFLAPSYSGSSLQSLLSMIRILAPIFLFTQTTKLLISILNAYGSFIIPEISGLISQVLTTILLILLTPHIGILSLVVSYYASITLLLALLCIQLSRLGVTLLNKSFTFSFDAVKPFILYSLPFFIPYFAGQASQLVEKALASSSVGAVSIIDYSRKFSDIPLEVMVGIIVTMLVPVLSQHFVENRKQDFFREFKNMYQFGLLLLICLSAMLISCPAAFVKILYHKGMSDVEMKTVSHMTMLYVCSAIPVFLYQIYGAALIAAKRGSEYAYCGLAAQLIMITINLVFYKQFGIFTLPISLFISHAICAGIMALRFPVKNSLGKVTIRYFALLLSINTLVFFLSQSIIYVGNPYFSILLHFVLLLSLLFPAIFFFKFDEREIIIKNYRKYLHS